MRIVIAVNVDWFFLSHRLPIAQAALKEGHEVHIVTTLTNGQQRLEDYGFVVHPVDMDRSSAGPLGLLVLLFRFLCLFWKLRPDVVHLVTIKPVLIGGLAARFSPVRGVVYAVSGLGHVFVADGVLGRFRRRLVALWYRFILGISNMRIIFQNPDDRQVIEAVASLQPKQIAMIPGSGVDLSEYQAWPLPDGVPVILMAARLLATKGVREFVAAARQLKREGVSARFWLIGGVDLVNPAAIQPSELELWERQGDVELLGHRTDIPELMAQAHIVVLPSYYGEGLPKVLIEAAACARAVITTDMPGCRDAIVSDVTGLLIPPKDSDALAKAIQLLLTDPERCRSLGNAGHDRAKKVFDIKSVVAAHLDIYRTLGGH